jgi:hypothetical protein
MLLIVYPAFFLLKSQRGSLVVVHLLLKDIVIGRKLMMVHCSFLVHMRNGSYSPQNNVVKCCDNLKNQS